MCDIYRITEKERGRETEGGTETQRDRVREHMTKCSSHQQDTRSCPMQTGTHPLLPGITLAPGTAARAPTCRQKTLLSAAPADMFRAQHTTRHTNDISHFLMCNTHVNRVSSQHMATHTALQPQQYKLIACRQPSQQPRFSTPRPPTCPLLTAH